MTVTRDSSPKEPLKRFHITTPLKRESLIDKDVVRRSHADEVVPIIPYADFVMVGGLSVFDRGAACLPLVEELGGLARDGGYKLVVGIGTGARVRHAFHVCLDLGLPVGCLGQVMWQGQYVEQVMLTALLARWGGVQVHNAEYLDLPLFLGQGLIPVVCATAPYSMYEPPPYWGRVPMHGSDFGLWMLAEALGARSVTLLKDVDGLYDADPKKNPDARLIPRIGARELIEMDLRTLPVDRVLLETLLAAHSVKQVRLANGLVQGNLTRILAGEDIGTVIYKDE